MSDSIVEGGVVEVYVEDPIDAEISDDEAVGDGGSDYEHEMEQTSEEDDLGKEMQTMTESKEDIETQVMRVREFYSSPSKKGKEVVQETRKDQSGSHATEKKDLDSSSESEYMPGDSGSSEDDVEAVEIQRKFKEFKHKMRKGEVAQLDDIVLETLRPGANEDGYCTPYADSNDDKSMSEMGSDGHMERKASDYPRYD